MQAPRFQIYKASAGSGKTYTLVRDYLFHALKTPQAFRSILAITFTNKAANEMKSRVLRALTLLADAPESTPLTAEIAARLQIPLPEIASRAAAVHTAILHDYGHFGISTIDAFTLRLIRNFSRDLQLPTQFEVDTDVAGLRDRITDQLLDAVGRDEYLTRILVHFAEQKLERSNSWQWDQDVQNATGEIFSESSRPFLDKIREMQPDDFLAYIARLEQQKQAFYERLRPRVEHCLRLIEHAGLTESDFLGGRYSLVHALRKLRTEESPARIGELLDSPKIRTALLEDVWSNKSGTSRVMPLVESGLRSALEAVYALREDGYSEFVTAWMVYEHIHTLAVLRQAEDWTEAWKEKHNFILIGDFQRKIGDFIRSEAPDYIYWRLGEQYRHYLLDEFQDTSAQQWSNLWPLFEYLQAEPEREGSLLLVGDSKQGIYRWRGGDIVLMEYVAPESLRTEALNLSTNYRSGGVIVDFNNRFFNAARDVIASNTLIHTLFTGFEQACKPAQEGRGLVRFEFLGEDTVAAFKEKASARTLEIIQALLQEGYAAGDIALLFRNNSDGALVAAHLHAAGIPVISNESLLLSREPVITFIVSLLRFLHDYRDELARAEVLHYFFWYLHREETPDPAQRIRELLLGDKPARELLDLFPPAFRQLRNRLGQAPLYEIAEEIIRIFDLHTRGGAWLQHFLDMVLEFSERRRPDIAGFLEFWEREKDRRSVTVPPGENAVEILTIHKSKGLEFPVVILPFADWPFKHSHSTLWTENAGTAEEPGAFRVPFREELKESRFRAAYEEEDDKIMMDNLNLLYVALTRPEDRLYVLTQAVRESKKDTEVKLSRLHQLLDAVMKTPAFVHPEPGVYECGFPEPPPARKPRQQSVQPATFPHATWRKRIRVERRFRQVWDSPEAGAAPVARNVLAAEVLNRLRNPDHLPRILRDMQESGILPARERDSLRAYVQGLLHTEPLQGWLGTDWKRRSSPEYVSPEGEVFRAAFLASRGQERLLVQFGAEDPEPLEVQNLHALAASLGIPAPPAVYWFHTGTRTAHLLSSPE